jgi:hypothetical protein
MERFRCYYCQDHTENECSSIISHRAKEHDTLCLKYIENQNYTKKQGALAIEQNISTLSKRICKYLGCHNDRRTLYPENVE